MSHILKALKKAELERNMGNVPGIFSEQQRYKHANAGLLWRTTSLALGLVVLLAGAAVAWYFVVDIMGAEEAQKSSSLVATRAHLGGEEVNRQPQVVELVATDKAGESEAVMGQRPDIVPDIASLPEEIRRRMPTIILTGHVYTEKNKERRIVIVNDAVVRENEFAGAGLLVKDIMPRSVVFLFDGHYFSMRASEINR